MDVTKLRAATAADHDAVESSMPLMGPHLDRNAYTAVLLQLRPLIAAWETLLHEQAPPILKPLVEPRCRLALLDQDLVALGAHPAPSVAPHLPSLNTSAHLYGAMYVMEGSRLGGQFIARHIDSLFPEVHATRYFRGFDSRTGPMWKEFLHLLEEQVPDQDTDDVIAGARLMFKTFGDWMRQAPAP